MKCLSNFLNDSEFFADKATHLKDVYDDKYKSKKDKFNKDKFDYEDKCIKDKFIYGTYPHFKKLNKEIYDSEFANFNYGNTLSVNVAINLLKFLNLKFLKNSEYLEKKDMENYLNIFDFCDDIVFIDVNFDKSKIGTMKFTFSILKECSTEDLIHLFDYTSELIDKYFFNILKSDLFEVGIESELLTKHTIYSVIISNNISKDEDDKEKRKRELFGIAFDHPNYKIIDSTLINKAMKNVPVFKEDDLVITTVSTFILFPTLKYKCNIDMIVEIIELFWRQKCLLRKIDFQMSEDLTKISETSNTEDYESKIVKTRDTQRTLNSDLEVYRNNLVYGVQYYTIVFETLNSVFKMDKHYSFVKAKMDACMRIFQQLHDKNQSNQERERKNLLYVIQWLVAVLGILTLISTVIVGIYSPLLRDNFENFVIFIVLIIGLAIIGYSFFLRTKNSPITFT